MMLAHQQLASLLWWAVLGFGMALFLAIRVRRWVSRYTRLPYLLGFVSAGVTLSVFVGWRFEGDPARWAWWWLAMVGLGLAVIDVDCHRLPRSWVVAMAAGGSFVFSSVGLFHLDARSWLRAVLASVLVLVAGVAVQWLFAGHMGFGDVTLLSALALYWGWVGWRAVALGVVVSFLLLGVVAAIAWLLGNRGWRSRFAAGPSLVAGGWVGVLV